MSIKLQAKCCGLCKTEMCVAGDISCLNLAFETYYGIYIVKALISNLIYDCYLHWLSNTRFIYPKKCSSYILFCNWYNQFGSRDLPVLKNYMFLSQLGFC